MMFFEVAVAAPLSHTLTYKSPEIGTVQPVVGMRVLVPLGRRLVTGYILTRISEEDVNSDFQIKSIVEVLDSHPLFPVRLIAFYRWIAGYYHFPLGEVIRTALPGGLTTQSGTKVLLTETGMQSLAGIIGDKECKNHKANDWREKLKEKGVLSPAEFRKICRRAKDRRLLKKWQEQGLITLEREIIGSRTKPRFEKCVRLTMPPADCQDILSREKKLKISTKKTFESLLSLTEDDEPVARRDLTKVYRSAGIGLRELVEKGMIVMEERRVYRNPFGEKFEFFAEPKELTDEQIQVLDKILPTVEKGQYSPFLLHGITGSGKTEVYLQAAAKALANNRTVLVLVPEIALATQLESHFLSRFGDQTAVLHSGLSAGERLDQWQRIQTGEARIVVGARSAVFAPLRDEGLIIVDEEHESAYKQDNGLRYNGRDVAILRAKLAGCPVVLGSATPSVTSYYHAGENKYTLLSMRNRVAGRKLPSVEIVDLNKDKTDSSFQFFTKTLLSAVHENFRQGHQTLLFMNRRGYAGFMLCRDCGHIIQCRNCQVSLTLHRGRGALVCHYCGYQTKSKVVCPECLSHKVAGLGIGSERIEEEIIRHVPKARVARLDSDTTASRTNYLRVLKAVRNQEIDILVGTQMIAKGLHFPHMTLVGIIWADSGLGIPDFRASEKTFQLLAQVTGRAGRGDTPGRVIIQTHQPDHYTVRYARNHDYEALFNKELEQRQALHYPPCSRLVNIKLSGENESKVKLAAEKTALLARHAASQFGPGVIDILGPAPAPLARIKNRSRYQLLLKSGNVSGLHDICEHLLTNQTKICKGADVRMNLDIDPENMM